jgi:ABC-type antimicrobial peptide transport system permease subunit
MNQSELNTLPDLVQEGKMSQAYASHKLALYVRENRTLFGLHKKNEDFNSDIIVMLLEKSKQLFEQYNSQYGSFFTYFFCFIKSLINMENKKLASQKVIDFLEINDCITSYSQREEAYKLINYSDFEQRKVPFAYKAVSSESLKIACNKEPYHIKEFLAQKDDDFKKLQDNLRNLSPSLAEKILLVLALKSAYYITDQQITKIAEICHIDINKFHAIVMNLKSELTEREKNKSKLEIRRNSAYFQHRKYRNRIEWSEAKKDDFSPYEKHKLSNKYEKQTNTWKKLNQQLKKGIINIRPTNKAIAKALGMCERQISFYIKNAYLLGLKI